MNTIEATYEAGILRPSVPPDLFDGQRVRILVEAPGEKDVDDVPAHAHDGLPPHDADGIPSDALSEVEAGIRSLAEEGLITLPAARSQTEPVSEAERVRLADILGRASDRLVSDIVIEERGW